MDKEIPKNKTAKLEDFYGYGYQFYILKALKNGEGEHDFRHDNRRVSIFSSSTLDEDRAIKLRNAFTLLDLFDPVQLQKLVDAKMLQLDIEEEEARRERSLNISDC